MFSTMKHPNIKINKNAVEYRYCIVCGNIMAVGDNPIGELSSSISNDRVCVLCAGEQCQQNYRHKVEKLNNGLHYCKQCKRIVEETGSYREHIKENDIKVGEAQITYL